MDRDEVKTQYRKTRQPSKEAAQKFLDDCVRQNTSALVEAIQIIDHLEYVSHTPEERLIYRQVRGSSDLRRR